MKSTHMCFTNRLKASLFVLLCLLFYFPFVTEANTTAVPTQGEQQEFSSISERIDYLLSQLGLLKVKLAVLQGQEAENEKSDQSATIAAKVLGTATGKYPETNLMQSCFDKVWDPGMKSLANNKNWLFESGVDRVSYTYKAPGGHTALVIKAFEGEPAGQSRLRIKLSEADTREPVVARIMTTVYIPEDNGFNEGNGKMPLGIWGGGPGSVNCLVGGCPPPYNPEYYPMGKDVADTQKVQNGFSVRLSRKALDKTTEPVTHGPKIYSYNLNREYGYGGSKLVANNWEAYEAGDAPTYKVYGQSERVQAEGVNGLENVAFPTGEWFKLIMDVRINSGKTVGGEYVPKTNGFVDLYMYDMDNNLLGEAHENNLIFREDANWYIKGPWLADLWGGTYTNTENIPTKKFKTYYRDYKMYFLEEGKLPSECKQ